jgi:hypothetical protein
VTRPAQQQPTPVRLLAACFAAGLLALGFPHRLLAGQEAGPVGFALGLTELPREGLPPAVRRAARSVKMLADWSAIEPVQGRFEWGAFDRAVAAARDQGLSPVGVLAFTPRWATLATGADLEQSAVYTRMPPRRLADWERFVRAAATRYRGAVSSWQVWTVPNLPHFRGTAGEYVALVRAAWRALGAADRHHRLVLPSPGGIDLVHARRLLQEAGEAVGVVEVRGDGRAPETWLRPLATLRTRVLQDRPRPVWLEWSAEPAAGTFLRAVAVLRASGVERLFLSPARLQRLEPAEAEAAASLEVLPFAGYLVRDPGTFLLVFGSGDRSVLVAWRPQGEAAVEVPLLPSARLLFPAGPLPPADEGRTRLGLSARPLVAEGLDPALVQEAQATLAQRGPLLPPPVAGRDYSAAGEVRIRLGPRPVEEGLLLVPPRRPETALEPVEVLGEAALRTNGRREAVFLYLDVDDTFLFFNDGRFVVEVTVEVLGARRDRTVGFNLLYDSDSGYRFTPWQWVEARDGWVAYTLRLTDAAFANTAGWDLAVNGGGNRMEELTLRSVVVRKVPGGTGR